MESAETKAPTKPGFPGSYLPVLSEAEWRAVKLASIRGVTDKELSQDFGVAETTIRKRRSRDSEWKAAVQLAANRKQGHWKVTRPPEKEAAPLVEKAVTASLDSIAQANPLLAARAAHEAMQRSVEQGLLPDPSTWQEFATANKLVRTNTGLDKAEGTITLNLWSGRDLGDTFAGGVRDVSEAS